jgi:hypothetical protein
MFAPSNDAKQIILEFVIGWFFLNRVLMACLIVGIPEFIREHPSTWGIDYYLQT